MLLPAPLQDALRDHLSFHGCWHVAREPGQEVLRRRFKGECSAELHALDQEGSGCDFLRFHRRMMRHFRWTLGRTPTPDFRLETWVGPVLPPWVEDAIRADRPEFDLGAAYETIGRLARDGTIEELGTFIEQNPSNASRPGAGIHTRVHRAVARFESTLYGTDRTGLMSDLRRAPLNIFFWTLHGWIDDFHAEWQRRHGETPDQSPAEMEHVHVTCVGVPTLPP
jgi:hypothetical protein